MPTSAATSPAPGRGALRLVPLGLWGLCVLATLLPTWPLVLAVPEQLGAVERHAWIAPDILRYGEFHAPVAALALWASFALMVRRVLRACPRWPVVAGGLVAASSLVPQQVVVDFGLDPALTTVLALTVLAVLTSLGGRR